MGEGTARIGRYATRHVLGSGAFATVWLGRDDELDVPVAIKVLADNWAHNGEVRARFVDEARTLRRISDSRVIGVHDIGALEDGRSYFVMDYADGGTLADHVGQLDRGTALAFAVEIAQAVQVLHDHGVLHRDVKPSNLLLRRRPGRADQLMIADLGTAKALAEASGLTLSAGTPAYMAPEQAHGRWGLDERADVYALGAVAYALLTGRPPFAGEREMSDVAFRDPRQRAGEVDGGGPLDALLTCSLAFDPDERPATAHEFADRLLRIAIDDATSRGDDQPTRQLPAIREMAGPDRTSAVTRTPITAPTRSATPPGRTDSAADPSAELSAELSSTPDRERPAQPAAALVPDAASARSPVERTDGAHPAPPAPRGLTPGALVSLALLLFVVAAVGTWLLLSRV